VFSRHHFPYFLNCSQFTVLLSAQSYEPLPILTRGELARAILCNIGCSCGIAQVPFTYFEIWSVFVCVWVGMQGLKLIRYTTRKISFTIFYDSGVHNT